MSRTALHDGCPELVPGQRKVINAVVSTPPPDTPPIMMALGSPPNREMLARTQSSAAT